MVVEDLLRIARLKLTVCAGIHLMSAILSISMAAEEVAEPAVLNMTGPDMLNTYAEDNCCGRALAKALSSGALDDKTKWTHEKCGLDWRVEIIAGEETEVRHWSPHPLIEVWR